MKKEWLHIYQWLVPDILEKIWYCNINPSDVNDICVAQVETLKVWSEFHFHKPQCRQEVLDQIIWYNSLIRVNNKPMEYHTWLFDKIQTIQDITGEDGHILEWSQLRLKFNLNNKSDGWLWYTGLVKALPQMWRILLEDYELGENHYYVATAAIVKIKKPSVNMYNFFLYKLPSSTMAKYVDKWNEKTKHNLSFDEYVCLFKWHYMVTNNVKLLDFQYRLLLGKIFANDILCKWGIVDTQKFNFCKTRIQNTVHMLIECETVQIIWQTIASSFKKHQFSIEKIMSGKITNRPKDTVNLIGLITKQYIYHCKCMENLPSLRGIKNEITLFIKTTIYNCNSINEQSNVKELWNPVLKSLQIQEV